MSRRYAPHLNLKSGPRTATTAGGLAQRMEVR